jgi:hypothetical protein
MPAPPENPDTSSSLRLASVLLVEDDLDHAHLLKFLLEAGGDYR